MFDKSVHEDALKKKSYLKGKMLKRMRFQPSFPAEYTCCVFCWSQISAWEEDLHDGFYEQDSESWICEICREEFASDFGWSIDCSDERSISMSEDRQDTLGIPLF